jgi:hypothetical protein
MGIGVTLLGTLWFYGIMHSWLWLGLMGATTWGWIIGYAILFIFFLGLSCFVVFGLGLGYLAAFAYVDE